MKWIMGRCLVADADGYKWEVELLEDGTATLRTPDDPEHWAYGENGPKFRVAELLSAFAIDPAPNVLAPKP